MKNRTLNAKGKGEYSYDYSNDIMLFKIKDRDYLNSLDFDDCNLVVDFDTEGFITGIRIFDASKVLNLTKVALNDIKGWDFNASVENNVIKIQLRFVALYRNKEKAVNYAQNFVRESSSVLNDSVAVCSV
ncbi:MAG: DUF2283 domain-containing protein [Nanoarchaeota archaeon]